MERNNLSKGLKLETPWMLGRLDPPKKVWQADPAEAKSAWNIFIALHCRLGDSFLHAHQRMYLYQDLRGEGSTHLQALRKCLRTQVANLPVIWFSIELEVDGESFKQVGLDRPFAVETGSGLKFIDGMASSD